jgi:hypothetical protein
MNHNSFILQTSHFILPPMPRYVILTHDWPFHHFDLMLEWGTALRTWRLAGPPTPAGTVSIERLVDHRLDYLDYEGPVSGGRGQVARWDQGTFEILDDQPGELTLLLSGERLSGQVIIASLSGNNSRITVHSSPK